jgi:uncharacterized alkaline shock family protein YloU
MTETLSEPTQGRVKVANEVIAQIAAMTALQVPGVAGVADRTNQITRVIRRGGIHKGVRVELDGEESLRLQLSTSTVDVYFVDVRFSEAPAG